MTTYGIPQRQAFENRRSSVFFLFFFVFVFLDSQFVLFRGNFCTVFSLVQASLNVVKIKKKTNS